MAITGSAGKTSTKEATAEFPVDTLRRLPERAAISTTTSGCRCRSSSGSSRPEVAVVELGMNHPGEIRRLVESREPEIRVWTNVGDAHVGHFGSADAIADAKAEILESAGASTRLVANADDALVMAHAERFPGVIDTFGLGEDADVRAVDVHDDGIRGTSARLQTADRRNLASCPASRPRSSAQRARGRGRCARVRGFPSIRSPRMRRR